MAQMGARIAAAALLAVIGLTLIVFGVGFLAYAMATALAPSLGVAGGAAVTGAVFVVPPFLWAIMMLALRRTPPPKATIAQNSLWLTLFAAIAEGDALDRDRRRRTCGGGRAFHGDASAQEIAPSEPGVRSPRYLP